MKQIIPSLFAGLSLSPTLYLTRSLACLAASFSLCVLLGCSVDPLKVSSHAPRIAPTKSSDKSVSFDAESGVIKIDSVSAFLWPEGFNEAQRIEKIRVVKTNSDIIDALSVEQWNLAKREKILDTQWTGLSCVEKYAKLEEGQDPDDVDEVSEWKSPETCGSAESCAVDDQSCRDTIAACKADLDQNIPVCRANQDERLKTLPAQRDVVLKKQTAALKAIYTEVDPDFPASQQNYKSKNIDAKNSTVKITIAEDKKVQVEITIRGLFEEGTVFSTDLSVVNAGISNGRPSLLIDNASYDLETKLLKFSMRELKKVSAGESYRDPMGNIVVAEKTAVVATSGYYDFVLERAQNFAPDTINFVRFTGDMKLTEMRMDGSRVTRTGSSKIDGRFR